MTKFEVEAEKLAWVRQTAREEKMNEELLLLVSTRTKEQALTALYESLTFISGISDIIATERAKTLVF